MSSHADSLIEEICSSLTFFLLIPLQLPSFGGVAGGRVHASVSFEKQLWLVLVSVVFGFFSVFFPEGAMTRLWKRCSEGWSHWGTAGLFPPGAGGILRRRE